MSIKSTNWTNGAINSTSYTDTTINSTNYTNGNVNSTNYTDGTINSTNFADKWNYILAGDTTVTAGSTVYDARGLIDGTNTTYSTNWSQT